MGLGNLFIFVWEGACLGGSYALYHIALLVYSLVVLSTACLSERSFFSCFSLSLGLSAVVPWPLKTMIEPSLLYHDCIRDCSLSGRPDALDRKAARKERDG